MAEAVPFGIVTNILTKLGSSAFLEISSVYGVQNDMRKLESAISTIKAVLLDADQRQENSHLVRDWIKKLDYVVYDADDVMDAFSTKALQHELLISSDDGRVLNMQQQVREFFSTSNSLAFRYKMGQKIKEIRQRLDEIAADMRNLNFIPERVIVGARVNYNERETHSFVLMSEVIGRDKEKEEIIQLLICSGNQKENVSVNPIVGMGGLGKTTLAQLIYNDERVVKYFELRIWVCVSKDFETKSLVMKILKSITNDVVASDLDLEQLQNQLRQKLDGKRYLLMLDDAWNETSEKWVAVRNLLMGGAKGSSIVVTTRSRIVASIMGVEHPYVLEGLSEEISWSLFEKVAFGGHEKVNSKLKVIGKEIVKRCKGVPLAVKSLASVMQLKTEESEWLFIQNCDIWRDADILPILKLSYDHLPSYLKQCFAYCAIFPKDHEIEKEFLIQLWMAQGYVQSPDASQPLEEIGNQYFRDLLSRSFFQEARVDDGVLISCQMHDLIHDLAMRVAGFDCCIDKRDANNISERTRHVSIGLYGLTEVPTQLMKAKGLRTLLGRCSLDLHKEFRFLRVLDVFLCKVEKVPKSIGKLQHLRYLDLSTNYEMTSLPNSIRQLINLQTLKLSHCDNLKRLPEGITKLINLRYLVTNSCWNLKYMPSGMGKLRSLQRLDKFVVGENKWGLQLRELNGLNELKGDISIEHLENVEDGKLEAKEATLMAKKYLQSLTLRWGGSKIDRDMDEILLLEGLQPHPKLRELSIEGYPGRMFPSWMMTMVISLPNIVRITLERCDRCKHLPQSLDQLPSLKFLRLGFLEEVEHINDDENSNNLNGVVVERKSSSSTSTSTSTSTAAEGMSVFFPSLEELFIQNFPRLKGWWRAAAAAAEEEEKKASESSQRPSFPPRLTKLEIQSCPNLTSMPIHLPHLEKLVLYKVPEKLVRQLLLLTTTTSATTFSSITEGSAASSSSSSSSIPSSSPLSSSKLKSLGILEIEDLESPLPVEVLRNLASLETLEIKWCPRLSSCFALGSEKEEEEEEEEGFMRALLPSLRSLHILDCRSLTSFVVSGPGGITLQHLLPALQHLKIDACPNFDFSGDHGVYWQGMRSLLNLTIGGIPKLVSLPVWLQQLTTLQHLKIYYCPGLMAVPHWLTNLTSLHRLDILGGCSSMLRERCQKETGEDWPNISHIPTISINFNYIQRRRG